MENQSTSNVELSALRKRLSPSERKARHAAASRAYRDRTAGQIESRLTDRMIVEAIALLLERVSRREARDLLAGLQPLVVDGLVHKGHDRAHAVCAFDRRMRSLVEADPDDDRRPQVGFVRMAAKARAIGKEPGGFFKVAPGSG